MTASSWKERLQDQMPDDLAYDIDIFEGQMVPMTLEGIERGMKSLGR